VGVERALSTSPTVSVGKSWLDEQFNKEWTTDREGREEKKGS